jgi:hypothetical protein
MAATFHGPRDYQSEAILRLMEADSLMWLPAVVGGDCSSSTHSGAVVVRSSPLNLQAHKLLTAAIAAGWIRGLEDGSGQDAYGTCSRAWFKAAHCLPQWRSTAAAVQALQHHLQPHHVKSFSVDDTAWNNFNDTRSSIGVEKDVERLLKCWDKQLVQNCISCGLWRAAQLDVQLALPGANLGAHAEVTGAQLVSAGALVSSTAWATLRPWVPETPKSSDVAPHANLSRALLTVQVRVGELGRLGLLAPPVVGLAFKD